MKPNYKSIHHGKVLQVKSDKKLKEKLEKLIEEFGYWSEEVKRFNGELDYTQMSRINNSIQK